ncbi:nitrate reductase [Helicobacter sp. WB40]|uniref:nitrate reductase n=1 Tax=Helicobacter sp. WB40 TaxID=3004130 RepID=UPI0022EC0C93|nr:nitrate reductase [Helicobacter sp. WB40]MDA3966712.1 nitrate reductase [Helicobacter sp. WB40]
MLRIFMYVMLACVSLLAIEPYKKVSLDNNLVSSNVVKNKLLVGSDFGEVIEIFFDDEFFKIESKRLMQLPKVKTYFGDSYPRVFFVDVFYDSMLVLSEGDYGGKNLLIIKDGAIENILKNHEALNIKKAAFVNKDSIFIALASNEIMLYSLKDDEFKYKKQISSASFSDFSLNENKDKYVLSCESGIVYYGDVKNGEIITTFEGANKDNVYRALISDNEIIITAGQDRKAGIYKGREYDFIQTDFLVYSVGISKNGKYGAYMKNESSDIAVFSFLDKKEIAVLQGHTNVLNSIFFVSDNKIISTEDGKDILFWKLDK